MKTIIRLIFMVFTMSLFGCLGQHDYMIYTPNKAKVENHTGKAVSLNICSQYTSFNKQSSARQKILIPADFRSEIELVWDSKHEIKYDQNGGFEYKYPGNINYIHFSLEHSSFDLVKLCHNEFSTGDIIVNKYDSCPMGTVEQYFPSSCY